MAQKPILAAEGHIPLRSTWRDTLLCGVLALACLALYLLPTGFENRLPDNAVRCRATVLSVDNERVHQYGIVRMGTQYVTMRALDGPYEGQTWQAGNDLAQVGGVVVDAEAVGLVLAVAQTVTGEVERVAVVTERGEVGQEMDVPAARVHVGAVDEPQVGRIGPHRCRAAAGV